MRAIAILVFATFLNACATPGVAPREFLDEQTAATITVVAEPVIFVGTSSLAARVDRPRSEFGATGNRDYLELYGIDVNRMGSHQQYFVVQKWLGDKGASVTAVLELQTGEGAVELRSTDEDLRKLGLSGPIAPEFSKSSQWWYFPTDTATLRRVAGASGLVANLTVGDQRTAYALFSDGRAQLGALASALP
ncbi:MAG TPA: hypothetical protein PKE27_15585 [Povalibacter sp.]|uniref:hypothetical protein n=1 Tax=Povalibacter sp. TaxID=1962978 RepID=UPI002C0B24B9|nr:hypothetical protein [Povalibacter sp.]HMN45999.1 hypothetical protein [Povalibacter sp.]